MSNAMNLQLLLHFGNGPLAGQAVPVTKAELRMGSDPHLNDLVINDPSVMPEHARVVMDSNRYIIQARDAQCLLAVNFQPVEYALLQDGDQVRLGSSGISFTAQFVSQPSMTSLPSVPPQSSQFAVPVPPVQPAPQPQFVVPQPAPPAAPSAQFAPPVAPSAQFAPPFMTPASVPVPDAPFATPAPQQPQPAQFPQADEPPQRLSVQSGPQFAFSYAQQAQQQPLVPQMSVQVAYTETTRYLCAAAHLDERFRRFVLGTVVDVEHRAPGESYGVDIVPVLKVAYAARRRAFARDCVLTAILLIGVVLIGVLIARVSSLTSASPFGLTLPATSVNPFSLISSALSVTFTVLAIVYLFFYVVTVLVISLIARLLSRDVRLGTIFMLVFLVFFWPAIPFFLVAWITTAIDRAVSYYGADAGRLAKNNFNPASIPYPLNPQVEQKVRSVFPPAYGNVVVYSGYSPFAGAGIRVGGWSFPVNVTKGKHEAGTVLTPQAFRVDEIYAYVANALKDIDLEGKSELCGTVMFEDKLYVNGQAIRDDIRFLQNPFARPYNQLHEQLLEQFKLNPTQDTRFYRCIRLISGRGEMILSIFYRFVMVANGLYVETEYFLLPPLRESYYEIDAIEPTFNLHKAWSIIKHSFVSTTALWISSPLGVSRYLFADTLRKQQEKGNLYVIDKNHTFDYGSKTSIRAFASTDDYASYFQYIDREQVCISIVERALRGSIVEFLNSRNIDTASLQKYQETIVNNGIMISGRSLNAENIAAGKMSKATWMASQNRS